jgi:hypothetical protein
MQLESVKAAARTVVRSVGGFSNTFGGYVRTKRCLRCRHLLLRRAIVCSHCRRWQG